MYEPWDYLGLSKLLILSSYQSPTREIGTERKRQRETEREGGREGGRERERERERERGI